MALILKRALATLIPLLVARLDAKSLLGLPTPSASGATSGAANPTRRRFAVLRLITVLAHDRALAIWNGCHCRSIAW